MRRPQTARKSTGGRGGGLRLAPRASFETPPRRPMAPRDVNAPSPIDLTYSPEFLPVNQRPSARQTGRTRVRDEYLARAGHSTPEGLVDMNPYEWQCVICHESYISLYNQTVKNAVTEGTEETLIFYKHVNHNYDCYAPSSSPNSRSCNKYFCFGCLNRHLDNSTTCPLRCGYALNSDNLNVIRIEVKPDAELLRRHPVFQSFDLDPPKFPPLNTFVEYAIR